MIHCVVKLRFILDKDGQIIGSEYIEEAVCDCGERAILKYELNQDTVERAA